MHNQPLRRHEDRWNKMLDEADATLAKRKFRDAKKKYENAANYAKKHLGDDEYVYSLLSLSMLQRGLKLHKENEATLNKAICAALNDPNNDDYLYATALGELGWLHLNQMKTEKAIASFEIATEIFRRNDSHPDVEWLPSYIGLVLGYLGTNEFDKLEKTAQYACELSRKIVGPTDAATFLLLTLRRIAAKTAGKTLVEKILDAELSAIVAAPEEALTDNLNYGETILKMMLQ